MDLIRQKLLRDEETPHPIIETIREVCACIDAAQSRFEQETDPDLIEAAMIPARRVLSALTMLEMDDYVMQHSGKRYVRNVLLCE